MCCAYGGTTIEQRDQGTPAQLGGRVPSEGSRGRAHLVMLPWGVPMPTAQLDARAATVTAMTDLAGPLW